MSQSAARRWPCAQPREVGGLTQLGARFYEAANGRFIPVDPVIDITDPQQMHGCTYSNNAPPTFTDPTGLQFGSRWNKVTTTVSNTVDKVSNAVSTASTAVSDWADRNAEAINETLQFVAVAAAVVLVGMCAVPPGAGDLSDYNLCAEGRSCNTSVQNRGWPSPGMSCAERVCPGAGVNVTGGRLLEGLE